MHSSCSSTSDGAAVLLRPRTFDLLAALVDRAGHLVTKHELFERVWPKMVVEEAAVHVQISLRGRCLAGRAGVVGRRLLSATTRQRLLAPDHRACASIQMDSHSLSLLADADALR